MTIYKSHRIRLAWRAQSQSLTNRTTSRSLAKRKKRKREVLGLSFPTRMASLLPATSACHHTTHATTIFVS